MSDAPDRLTAALADRYRIERELGQGGMATVYLAEDLKHQRKVAVKVLRPELAAVIGAERFLSEIKTTANLQHPHILPLFDSGIAGGQAVGRLGNAEDSSTAQPPNRLATEYLFYVMPFIEGETVRDRLTREKQLPIADAVRIATEVASALDYAHRHNVIHRDIKPENILLHDGRAMVADFGIALAASKAGGSRMTETGMSLGTPTYMSPEQAMGEREITARSDVYALGAMTYEMLVGEPPFTGPTAQAIVAKVMTAEPASLRAQRKTIPPAVEEAVLTALEKLPADRFESAKAFAEALANPAFRTATGAGANVASPIAQPPNRLSALLAGIAVLATVLAAWGWFRPRHAPPSPVARVALSTGKVGAFLGFNIAISQDGTMIAYVGTDAKGAYRIFIRRLDREEPLPLAETEGGQSPIFSPDGAWVAFVSRGSLRKVAVDGGRAAEICAVDTYAGGSWGPDDKIAFSMQGNLYLVSASGGKPELLATPDLREQTLLVAPSFMPDGQTLLLGVRSSRASQGLAVMSLADRRVVPLGLTGRQGFLVRDTALAYFDERGELFTVPFDPRRLRVAGEPTRILDGVATTLLSASGAVAPNGTIAYIGGGPGARELVLLDRDGRARALPAAPALWRHPRFSPDGRQVAVGVETRGSRGDIWTYDLASGRLSRLTFDSLNLHPVWSPDGRYVYSLRFLGDLSGVARVRADGSAPAESLLAWRRNIWELEFTPDGRRVMFRDDNPVTARDIYLAPADSLSAARILLGSPLNERTIAISPDGRFFAYVSNASGGDEVYLRRVADESSTWPVSTGGGTEPRWARSGRELFYRNGDSLYVVAVSLGDEPTIGQPRALFGGRYEASIWHSYYDVSPDGTQFLMVRPQVGENGPAIHLVLNWFDQPRAATGGPRE